MHPPELCQVFQSPPHPQVTEIMQTASENVSRKQRLSVNSSKADAPVQQVHFKPSKVRSGVCRAAGQVELRFLEGFVFENKDARGDKRVILYSVRT